MQLIDKLNEMIAQEHACAIRYATHAVMVAGPYADVVSARLMEIAGDEISHANKLRERVVALGGIPAMDVNTEDLKSASELNDILEINIAEEKEAIRRYNDIIKEVPEDNVILHETLLLIIQDEQEHLEELTHLQSK